MHFLVTNGLVQHGNFAAQNCVLSYAFVCLFVWLVGWFVGCFPACLIELLLAYMEG
jgi:hypothetical protein